jgi:hypothetical protein
MQTLVEILFVLGLILPPAAVAVGVCVGAAGSMLVYGRSQTGDRRDPQQQPVALHPPAGR